MTPAPESAPASSGAQTGGCLCGKVRYTVNTPAHDVGVCHCGICRKWNGGPSFALHPETGSLSVTGEDAVSWYKSSEWGSRGFCGRCGANLFFRDSGPAPELIIAAGSLDDQAPLQTVKQIFIDEKPGFYALAGDIPATTGAEFFALYAAPPEENGA